MKKSILIFILLFSMILNLLCVGVNADSSTYSDEAITHLKNLGIIESSMKEDDYMTRGEFAQIISNLIGEAEPVAGTYLFADLSVEHKYHTAIQRCVQRGYMGGSDGLIRPDDYITYIEAMTVMARVLNYADYAKNNGDYTRGYYTTAKMLGILNNTNITSSEQPMLTADVAAMVYNAMKCNVNKLAQISPFYYEYTTVDKTLAYNMMSLNHKKGIMNFNGFMDITGNNIEGKYKVVIDNYGFSVRNFEMSFRNLIGQEVSVYYDDNYNIVSIAPTSENTVVKVERYDFVSYSDDVIKYLENDIERKVKTDGETVYFVNGKPVINFEATGFSDAHYADVQLVDNDADMVADAVFVSIYETFVVYSVDDDGIVLSYNNTTSVDLGEENNKETVIYNASGDVITVYDISPNSVISVVESDEFVYAKVVNSLVEGRVGAIDEYSVTIDNLECDVPNGTAPYFDNIKVGDYVKTFFDFDGRIVYVENNVNRSDNLHYGFIVNCELKPGIDKTLKIKLFTNNGKMEILTVKNKFKINGVPYTVSKLNSLPDMFLDKGKVKHSVIMYNLNPKGEVTEITFAVTYLGEDEDGFIQTRSKYKKSLTANGYYSQVFVNGSTTYFCVPTSNFDNEDEYEMLTRSQIPTTASHTIDAYHFSKNNNFADIIVLYGVSSPLTYNTQLSVVTKIGEGIDNNGNEIIKVTHFVDSALTVSVAKKESIVAKIKTYKPGDSVRISTQNGEITACERIYDYENGKFTTSSKAGTYATASLYLTEGYVASTNNAIFRISPEKTKYTTSDILLLDGFVYSSAKIFVVEKTQRGVDVKKVSSYNVKVGDHIVIQARSGTLKYVIIYRDI